MTNPVRFGQDFSGRVANPRDILQYHRKKKIAERSELTLALPFSGYWVWNRSS